MPTLIEIPQQQQLDDIDEHLELLVNEWYNGVMVNDAYRGEMFNMCVSLQLTIDDFLAYGNGNKTGSKIGVGANNVTKSFKMRQLHFDDRSDDDLENEGTFCFSQRSLLFELDYSKIPLSKELQTSIDNSGESFQLASGSNMSKWLKYLMPSCSGRIAITNTMMRGGSSQIVAKGVVHDANDPSLYKKYFTILGHIVKEHVIWRKNLLVFKPILGC